MKIKIEYYNIETDLDDIVQAFYDIDKDEVLESLDEDGTYYGDYFELTKDENNEIAFCELFIDSTQEILDMINDLKALKNDQFVLITRYYDYNYKTNEEYSTIDVYGDGSKTVLLIGGIYEYKSIATEEQQSKYWEYQENDLLESNAKYQDHYLIRLKDFNFDKWLDKWLSDDDKSIDNILKSNPLTGSAAQGPPNPRKSKKNINNDNGVNVDYINDFMYVKYNKTNGVINGLRETFYNDILIKSEEYKDGSINGIVKTFNKKNGAIKFSGRKKDGLYSIIHEYWDNSDDSTKWIPEGTVRNLNYVKNNIGYNLRFGINGGGGGGEFHYYPYGTVMNLEINENGYNQNAFGFGNTPIGIRYSFENNGNILFLTKYKDGMREDLSESDQKKLIDSVNIFQCHYPNGNILESREMKGGKVHGSWKRFYSNGVLRYITNHKNGVLDGEVKCWGMNGDLTMEGKWENGNLIGETYYNAEN